MHDAGEDEAVNPEAPPPSSPVIEELSWGRLLVEGGGRLKDAKLYPGGCREWDWRETGTRHSPGIQRADVEELLERGSRVVILSTGVLGRLQVPADTIAYLEERQVTVHKLRSREAVRLYNRLRSTERVGALIHSTC